MREITCLLHKVNASTYRDRNVPDTGIIWWFLHYPISGWMISIIIVIIIINIKNELSMGIEQVFFLISIYLASLSGDIFKHVVKPGTI